MRIVVFGASGRTGKLVVEQALARGYNVVAYVRDPSKLELRHERLEVVKGDLGDQPAIERAIRGTDAVVSVLGPRARAKGGQVSKGYENIVRSMDSAGIRRFIISSTVSVKDPNDGPDLMRKILVFIVKLLIRPAYEEIVRSADIVRRSDLDWTLVRLSLLKDSDATSGARAGYPGKDRLRISTSRITLARFVLDQLNSSKYIRKAPAISD